jgi:hypothetical protein
MPRCTNVLLAIGQVKWAQARATQSIPRNFDTLGNLTEYRVTLGDGGKDVEHCGFCEENRGLSSLLLPLYGIILHTS